MKVYVSIFLFCLFSLPVLSQETGNIPPDTTLDLSKFYDMTLEQLDSVKAQGVSSELEKFINQLMGISTRRSLSTRNNPNVVSLITRQEIENMGARDLIDVLRLVPGFNFAQDRNGNIGLGIRGNWANEGKFALLINGQEFNEHYTSHVYFGNHFPVDLIERIEIIRGPGSALYGGFSELGVINIITRSANANQIGEVGINTGSYGEQLDRTQVYGFAGTKLEDFELSTSFSIGRAQRSNREHYSFYEPSLNYSKGVGEFVNMNNNSDLNQLMANINLRVKDFSLNYLLDLYQVTNVNLIDENGNNSIKNGLNSNYCEMKWDIPVRKNITITPKLDINVQTPWEEGTTYAKILKDTSIADSLKGDLIMRFRQAMNVNWDLNHRLNLQFGGEHYSDIAKNRDTNSVFYVEDPILSYQNFAFYSQIIMKLPVFNFIGGMRYEYNNNYGNAWVPRVALTKKFQKWHYKVLFSTAFKAPAVGNIYQAFDENYTFNEDSTELVKFKSEIQPERTFIVEGEVGRQLGQNAYLNLNLYHMWIDNPIVYTYYEDTLLSQGGGGLNGLLAYQNYSRSGTFGAEIDFRWQPHWGYLNINYAYYTAGMNSRVAAYKSSSFHFQEELRVEQYPNSLLGMPNHRLNINLNRKLGKDWRVNLSANLIGKRYAYDIQFNGDLLDSTGNVVLPAKYNVSGVLKTFDPITLVNLYVHKKDLLVQGLNIGFGMYNIFDAKNYFLQPYFGLRTPLPDAPREFIVKLSYNIPTKKAIKRK